MTKKSTTKTKLTDAERHKRFVSMAREVQAEESKASFDRAFARVTRPQKSKAPKR